MHVSGKNLNLNDDSTKKLLLWFRLCFGCLMLGVVCLGTGIALLCLDISFKLALAITISGSVFLVMYFLFVISFSLAFIDVSNKRPQISLKTTDIPEGYKLGDPFIPVKPKEEEKYCLL